MALIKSGAASSLRIHLIARFFFAITAASAPVQVVFSLATNRTFPEYIAKNLGSYSPYYPSGTYEPPPSGCTITQVDLIQRHGSRYPTSSSGKKISASVAKLQAASLSPSLLFVENYTYSLGVDDLTPFGALESFIAGQLARQRYKSLELHGGLRPFVRSDSSQRVIDSATNWTAGFYGEYTEGVAAPVVIYNKAGSNDTLDDKNCPNAPELDDKENAWLRIFATNITARLNAQASGADLTNKDTRHLMELCGFDTESSTTLSPFCGLFQPSEWDAFEYYYDLDKYYGTGYGNPLGPVQGVGYINELLTRLTGDTNFVNNDQTQVNHSLDNDPRTFPIGPNVTFYADFSHDNEMAAIFSAIGLKNGPILPATGPPAGQSWITSQIVPFAGRLVTERLECTAGVYVRFLLNDALQQPQFCSNATTQGLCPLDAFVASQSYSINNGNGDWLKCGYEA